MKLADLLKGLEYKLCGVDVNREVKHVCSDSRKADLNSLFVCIKGSRRDGHEFARHAIEKGAVVMSEKELDGAPCVITADTRLACARINSNFYGEPQKSMRMIGVTGTNGKTSVAAFLESIYKSAGVPVGVIGTLGMRALGKTITLPASEVTDVPSAMTTPDPSCLYEALSQMKAMGVKTVIMEASSHSIAQKKTEPINFDVGIFTNLSAEHLDFHQNVSEYFKIKASLFEKCKIKVVNIDDPHGKMLAEKYASAIAASRTELDEIKITDKSVSYKYGDLEITSPIAADFTLENTLLAVKCAEQLGIEEKYIEKGISSLHSIPGRMEHVLIKEKYGFDAYVDYAHTPYAMENVMRTVFKTYPDRKTTVLFGCGGDRDRSKRSEMGRIAAMFADKVIVTNDNPRKEDPEKIINDILVGISDRKHVSVIPDRRVAIDVAVQLARPGDIILLLGKGHEEYEIDSEGMHPFSERDILRECAERRLK